MSHIKKGELYSKRSVAAQWILQQTGKVVDTSSDQAFRAALRDGVVLCRLLNAVQAGIVPKVGEFKVVATAQPLKYVFFLDQTQRSACN